MFKLDYKPHSIDEIDDILYDAINNGTQTNTRKIAFYNIVCAFDIETSSFTDHCEKGDNNNKRSIMYVWQLAINGRVIVGREWSEFLYCISRVIEVLNTSFDKRLIIYVHNLAFEFQYIRKFFKWKKVFSIDKRKPIYAITENGIEFRCSYILTNYSLEKLADQITKPQYKVKKLVGDLDYSLVRTPLTPLSDSEMQYCINDVLVISGYIKEQIEKEKYIHRIPITCTGYCRRFVRKNCLYGNDYKTWKQQHRKYHAQMKALRIQDLKEYDQLQRAFQGGFTHAAADWSTFTVDNVDSIDFTSSYPFVLLSEMMPMSTGEEVTIHSQEELEKYLKCYCCLFDVKFYELKPKFEYESYIPAYKCFLKVGVVENNGRVYSASMIATTITEVDFSIINHVYSFDHMEICSFRIYRKNYVPVEIVNSIISLYKTKTTMKGVAEKQSEYLVAKGLLNSVY